MKAKDIKQLSQGELLSKAAELRGKIRDLRFTVKTRQHAKVRDLRHAKSDLARVLGELKGLGGKIGEQNNKLES